MADASDAVGFPVLYAHDLPDGWRLVDIAVRGEDDGRAVLELRYYGEAGDVSLTIRQRAGVPASLGLEEGYRVTPWKEGRALLRAAPGTSASMRWFEKEMWVEAESRLTAEWDLIDQLRTLQSVY